LRCSNYGRRIRTGEPKRFLYFSLPRFISDICQGTDCFICGAKSTSAQFNDEHILPDWILRRYDLRDRALPKHDTIPLRRFQDSVLHRVQQRDVDDRAARQQILEGLKTGLYTFLADDEGKFQRDYMELE